MDYWRIWFNIYEDDKWIGTGVWYQHYKYKKNAQRRAKQMWGKNFYNPMTGKTIKRTWIISQTNPWNHDILNKFYLDYKRNWCESRGYNLADVDEAVGINGECYACFDEWYSNEYREMRGE